MPPEPTTPDPHPQTWRADTYGEAFADVYDEWYTDVTDVPATVAAVTALGGPVLELGVGTGRLALALAAAGLEVHGVDASEAMVARLRAKPGGDTVTVTVADFGQWLPPGPFATVLLAFNTLFNLAEPSAQERSLALAAGALAPDGRLVIEAAVPDVAESADDRVRVRSITPERVVLSVSATDGTGATVGQFVELSSAGVVLRPWRVRLASPEQIDQMAGRAGLSLISRHAGWHREPFSDASATHVSVYGHTRTAQRG